MGDKLFEIDPEGAKEPRLISDQLGPGCGLNGMDWGPDDKLYGPRWFQGKVARVDVDSGKVETVADGFGVPAAVKFDSKGRLHVLDSQTRRDRARRPQTGERTSSAACRPRRGQRALPSCGADRRWRVSTRDADDRLFVSSFGDGFIVEVLDAEHTRTVVAGGINIPGGLALGERRRGGRARRRALRRRLLRAARPRSEDRQGGLRRARHHRLLGAREAR